MATDAEVTKDFATESAVGVLVVSRITDIGYHDEHDGEVIEEYFGDAVVNLVPTEMEWYEVGSEVGE